MKNILIVEDLDDVAGWLADMARRVFEHTDVVVAHSVAQANSVLKLKPFDLALIDIGLPDGSGIQLIGQLKRQHPKILCVMTTIFDDPGHLFPALRAGADGYLLKDDEEPLFADAMRGIVSGRPALSASMARMMLQQFRPQSNTGEVLSNREEEMLVLIANGYSVKRAAESLGISANTAASYIKSLYQKLQVNNRAEATLKAVQIGLINPERE